MALQNTNSMLNEECKGHSALRVVRTLLSYIVLYKYRVLLGSLCLLFAKFSSLAVPIVFKNIVDYFYAGSLPSANVSVPLALICAYGMLRLTANFFVGIRDVLFEHVYRAVSRFMALGTFLHLHALSLNFHLSRRSGGVTREINLGMVATKVLMSRLLENIVPVIVEIALVLAYLTWHYKSLFSLIICTGLVIYIAFTMTITNWRTQYKRQANGLDSQAAAVATDSLLNFETVKYFNLSSG